MKLLKIFSVILALMMFANPTFCNAAEYKETLTVSEQVHHANVDILKDYIIKFHAIGGAYIVYNLDTKELADKEFIEMGEGFPIWSHNVLRLINYAVGMNRGTIKEDEAIIFNTDDFTLFDRIAKADLDAFLKPFVIGEKMVPMTLLEAYVKVFENPDNYLTEAQLNTLKSAVSDNVRFGQAKRADVEGYNVSGLSSTSDKDKKGKAVYTTFVGEFEANGQHYAIVTVLDNPKARPSTYGHNSSGWNAVPLAAKIIKNIGQK